jgi:hypothetical protein
VSGPKTTSERFKEAHGARIEPPGDLTPAEKAEFRQIAASPAAALLIDGDQTLLTRIVRGRALERRLAAAVEAMTPEELGQSKLPALLLQSRQNLLACERSARLSPMTRGDSKSAAPSVHRRGVATDVAARGRPWLDDSDPRRNEPIGTLADVMRRNAKGDA